MRRGGMILAAVATLALGQSLGQTSAARAENGHKGDTTTYRAMDTLTATLRRGDNSLGVLSVQAGLDASDPKMRKLVEQSLPRLRDAYVQVLGIYAAGLTPGGGPNADQIAQLLQRATDRVLGRPGAKLLLGTVMVN
jgi:ABC-type transporter lipoprotein component MlaA